MVGITKKVWYALKGSVIGNTLQVWLGKEGHIQEELFLDG